MKLGKNVVVWLIAFVALSTVMSFFENRNFASNHENLAFSDFMNEVKSKRIASVTMSGAEIYTAAATHHHYRFLPSDHRAA